MNILHLHSQQQDRGFSELLKGLEGSVHNVVVNAEQRIESVDLQQISLNHAHNWLMDGPLAVSLQEQLHIPFLVSITEEDCEGLMSWRFKSRNYAILQAADKVLMPTPAIQKCLANKLPNRIADEVFSKMIPLGNGIVHFWLDRLRTPEPVSIIHIRLLFVGMEDADAHLRTMVKAVEMLRHQNFDVTIDAVLLDDVKESAVAKAVLEKPFVRVLQVETDEEWLRCFRNHDVLVMLSGKGVEIYLQALSQGLPLIYSRDGFFAGLFQEGMTGFAVNPGKADDVAEKILEVSQRYGTIVQHISDLHPLSGFNWNDLIPKYLSLYARLILN